MRDYKQSLLDIRDAIRKIDKFTKGLSGQKFAKNELVLDAVIRNLEVIGEASKNIPAVVRKDFPGIEWRKISALRNILIHEYFGVDHEILWDIVSNKIPELKKQIAAALRTSK